MIFNHKGITKDFGQTTQLEVKGSVQEVSSSTRGLFGGGFVAPTSLVEILNTIEFVTIANTANATDFGDLTSSRIYGTASNQTRGIIWWIWILNQQLTVHC